MFFCMHYYFCKFDSFCSITKMLKLSNKKVKIERSKKSDLNDRTTYNLMQSKISCFTVVEWSFVQKIIDVESILEVCLPELIR